MPPLETSQLKTQEGQIAARARKALILGFLRESDGQPRDQIETQIDGAPEGIRDHIRTLYAIHSLRPTTEDFLESLTDGPQWMHEPPFQAFKTIDRLLCDYCVAKARQALPPDHATADITEVVLRNCDWKSVPEGSALQTVLLRFFSRMIHVRGELVRAYALESTQAQQYMSPVARVEYENFGRIADATNDFFLAWHEDAGSVMDTDERTRRGFTDELATIREGEDGQAREIKWHEVFPEQTKFLARCYFHLADKLRNLLTESTSGLSPEDKGYFERKIAYYIALGNAWRTSDLEAWRKADTMLPGQTSGKTEPMHIHTIEVGYSKDRVQRCPEASLRYPDGDFEEINRVALKTRARIVENLRRFFEYSDFSPDVKRTADLIEQRCVFSVRHFMRAGFEMVLRPTGQILPNEDKSRMEGGLDISADPTAFERRLPLIKAAFKAAFGTDLPDPDTTEITGRRTASHEYAHAIGLNPTLEERIPSSLRNPFVEEWKATVGGMIFDEFLPHQRLMGDPNRSLSQHDDSLANLRRSLLHHIALIPRYTSMRKEASSWNYARKSFMIANVATEAGILRKEGERWVMIDFSSPEANDAIINFYTLLYADYREVLGIYDQGSVKDLKAFLGKRLVPSEFLEFQAQKVDIHFGHNEMPTVQDLCALPS